MVSGRDARRRITGALVVMLLTCALAEGALHLFPGLLPDLYVVRFPMQGVEFLNPGALARTPIDELPFPLRRPYVGRPPADMQMWGLAPADVSADREKYPVLRFPADERGLPNEHVPERADVLLVGDSFTVGMSILEPPGLQAELARVTGKTVYNLGVAGIGPRHELWLLEEVGLDLAPELVLWFFYAGNDLVDERKLLVHEAAGAVTHADREDYRPVPRLRIPSIWRELSQPTRAAGADPLPGFRLPGGVPLWFLPDNLWRLSLSRERWEGHRGWPSTRACILRARDLTRDRGARFALVYLPSKAEVYWPFVEQDAELLRRYLQWELEKKLDFETEQLKAEMNANLHAQEDVLSGLCEKEDIPFFSARPALEERARRGELVYLTVDSHWDTDGQAAALGPLVEFLAELGYPEKH